MATTRFVTASLPTGSTLYSPSGTLSDAFHTKRGIGLAPIVCVTTATPMIMTTSVAERLVMAKLSVCAAKPDAGCACRVAAARRQTDGYGCDANAPARRQPDRYRAPRRHQLLGELSRLSASRRGAGGFLRRGAHRGRSNSVRPASPRAG